MENSSHLLIDASIAEADLQAARLTVAAALGKRDAVLYAMWRETKDPRQVASQLPRSVTVSTVRRAVLKLAPPQDFTQLELFGSPANDRPAAVELAA